MIDEQRRKTSNIKEDWRSGMSYHDLHVKYGPWGACECDACTLARDRELEAQDDE